jgi:hypothetical protein
VERAAARELQKEFDAAIGRLQARLAAWHASNAEEKRLIIRRAAALVELPDGREATETVKRLQAQWKELGAAAPDQDRGLWEEFRGHCDAVFQKRQQAHSDYTSSLQSNNTRAVALCEEAEQLAAKSGDDLLGAAARMAEWRAAFEGVGELPRAEERGLNGRFERALERVKAAISAQKARDKERSLEDLLEAASRIHAYGRGAASAQGGGRNFHCRYFALAQRGYRGAGRCVGQSGSRGAARGGAREGAQDALHTRRAAAGAADTCRRSGITAGVSNEEAGRAAGARS